MKESENKMKKAVDALERNLSQIRAGRANPAILDRVTVEYYGAPTPLAQVGTVSVPEARMIVRTFLLLMVKEEKSWLRKFQSAARKLKLLSAV